jgi:sulfite reductase (ferredoxin)
MDRKTAARKPRHKTAPSRLLPAPTEMERLAAELDEKTPQEILAWALETYGDCITLACSFGGPSGMVLLDMALRLKPDLPVFYLDTGLLFPETYALVEKVAERYHITPVALRPGLTVEEQSERYGDALWAREPDRCCDLRKVTPQREYLKGFDAWITGLRRDQASTRRATPVVQWDAKFGLAKLAPLAHWGEREVWSYIVANDVPYNPLHDQSYPSIGCTHCTRPVLPGEDMRAGRWSGFQKVECGIHVQDSPAPEVRRKVRFQQKDERMADHEQQDGNGHNTSLKSLGAGNGSKVEKIKSTSRHLRGDIDAQLHEATPNFSEDQVQLLKFHGTYQQDDRDIRLERRGEKAYQFMVRSRIPGGALTADQYLAEDDIAGQYANGTLRITTRQGIQLHGVLKGDLHATIHGINDALLSTLAACGDVNRNVMACPAPTGDRAHARVEEIAHEIAMHLAPRSKAYHEIWIDGEQTATVAAPDEEVEPIYGPTYLPRKFKIGVAFPGDNCIDVYTQDVGLIAEVAGEELVGFTLVIGGGMGMTHGKTATYPRLATPFCFVTPEQALPVIETIVMIQRDYGDRTNRKHARMKYVVEERGIAWFRSEAERRLGYTLAEPHPIHWDGADDHLGWHKQSDGNWYLGLYVENGRVKDEGDLRLRSGLRAAVERYRPGVRLTPQQNILLTDIAPRFKAPLRQLLARYGIITEPTELGVRRYALACPALPTCGLALAEAERALPDLIGQIDAELRELGLPDEPLSVRMTGCPNGCARPYLGDIGIVGRSKDLYHIYVGGDAANTRMNTLFAADVTRQDLVATLRPLLALWRDERRVGESLGDFAHRAGVEALRNRLGKREAVGVGV